MFQRWAELDWILLPDCLCEHRWNTQQVAFTSSNISGQAGTALALAAAPTQCSGAFATGIAANGNANCTTPNIIQLPETTQPAGIA